MRRSNQLSYEATDVGSWSFEGSNGSNDGSNGSNVSFHIPFHHVSFWREIDARSQQANNLLGNIFDSCFTNIKDFL